MVTTNVSGTAFGTPQITLNKRFLNNQIQTLFFYVQATLIFRLFYGYNKRFWNGFWDTTNNVKETFPK